MVLIEDITEQRRAEKTAEAEAAVAAAAAASSERHDDEPPQPPPEPPVAKGEEKDEEGEEEGGEEDDDVEDDLLPSDERLLDAQEIERVASMVSRPTAKLHLTSLATKLRREAEALQRMEKSRHLQSSSPTKSAGDRKRPAAASAAADENAAPSSTNSGSPAPTGLPPALSSPPPRPLPPPAAPAPAAAAAVPAGHYVPVDRFAFDAGGYNAPFVTLYVDLPGVGSLDRDHDVACRFTSKSVDLVVRNLRGKSHRLYRDNLDKDIDPSKSKIVVKSDKIIVKLAKIKSEYGSYDYWTQLTSKKKKPNKAGEKEDPSASIMQLMKDMYDEGDDNMRKVIGETMLKQQRGEMGKDPMGGMGGLGGMGGDDDDF